MSIDPGQIIDRYEVLRPLGRGGMAAVYQVRHTLLGTVHAMKVLSLPRPDLSDRLLREGRVAAQLKHNNIVGVSDVVPTDGGVVLIMDFVEGPNLLELLAMIRPSVDEIDALADEILLGVIAAHAKGVIHRDLKPGNVLMATSPGRLIARVTDFGLARALDPAGSDPRLTRSGIGMGSPAYMAPEQHRDAATADHRADVFSLGALLYELVTGTVPFSADNAIDLVGLAERGSYIPVADIAPHVPERFGAAISAALMPALDARPQSALALRELWRAGTPTPADPWRAEHLDKVAAWVERRQAVAAPVAATWAPAAVEPLPLPRYQTPWTRISLLVGGFALALLLLLYVNSHQAARTSPAASFSSPPASAPSVAAAAEPTVGSSSSPEPSVEPELAAAEPAPALAAAPARPPPGMGRVRVRGADGVVLVDANDRSHSPGDLAPGRYKVMLTVANGEVYSTMDLTLKAGEVRTINCNPGLVRCK